MRHTLGVQEVAHGHWVRSVGDVRRLERSLQLRMGLGLEVGHVLLRVLVLQASDLGLNVGVFLAMIRRVARACDCGGSLPAAQTVRSS